MKVVLGPGRYAGHVFAGRTTAKVFFVGALHFLQHVRTPPAADELSDPAACAASGMSSGEGPTRRNPHGRRRALHLTGVALQEHLVTRGSEKPAETGIRGRRFTLYT